VLVSVSGLNLDESGELKLDRDINAACRNAIFELLPLTFPGPLKSLEFVEKTGAP
jgi:hypothetical protein